MSKLVTVLGPTASGKTNLAVQIAKHLQAEIISADSRQVYQGMDIGTGKDLNEYTIEGEIIPHHLIDIVKAGTKYNLFEFQKDFIAAFNQISAKGKQAVLCGGTGLYIDAVTNAYKLIPVPQNLPLRDELKTKEMEELVEQLKSYGPLHNKTDIDNKKRVIRAIEIAQYTNQHPAHETEVPSFENIFLGVNIDRNNRRSRITSRLKQRLEEGMLDEVQALLDSGIAPEDLIYYGLEYKFVTQYLTGEFSYNDMFQKLNSAIHQFAKRQMTWFRKMEKEGAKIHWVNGHLPLPEKVEQALEIIRANSN